ncbi:MAG: class I SAM-dependent methyltransferase [Kineosporiaceae bacterium]|nr:class I SAM-dependent methyltransferase [Kineosporiaceae bacterium]
MTHAHGSEFPTTQSPSEFWEQRYAGDTSVWSGRVNATLADVLTPRAITPGRALDLGCGEGGDAIWLARQGWQVTAVDISPTAVARGAAMAAETGLDGAITWIAHDLTTWTSEATFDLVTASFFQAPVELARIEILRRTAGRIAAGGHLVVISHAAAPPWASPEHIGNHRFLTPAEELAELALADGWEVVLAEVRRREATGPDGGPAQLDDGVLLLRRR